MILKKKKEKQLKLGSELEQSSGSKRKFKQCKELGTGRYVWRWLFHYDVKTF